MIPSTHTPRFTVGASEYVKTDARQRLSHWWWCIAVPVVALCIAGIVDSRYFYLALMLIFIVYPMLLSFAWLATAAHKTMPRLTRPQEWQFSADAFVVDFYPFENTEDSIPLKTIRISNNDITDIRRTGKYWQFIVKAQVYDIKFLLIPAEYVPAENIDI